MAGPDLSIEAGDTVEAQLPVNAHTITGILIGIRDIPNAGTWAVIELDGTDQPLRYCSTIGSAHASLQFKGCDPNRRYSFADPWTLRKIDVNPPPEHGYKVSKTPTEGAQKIGDVWISPVKRRKRML